MYGFVKVYVYVRLEAILMRLVKTMSIVSILFCGAVFGFFYAWVCSTMWGLDQADPRIAIAAMQAMNASVRNAVFFPAFFLTPIVLAVAAGAVVGNGGHRCLRVLERK